MGYKVRVEHERNTLRFYVKDVCVVLDTYLRSPRGYLEVDTQPLRKIIGAEHFSHVSVMCKRKMLTISESGLYNLILKSRKPKAKAFQDWVTGTVLPAIRKDDMYVRGEEKVSTFLQSLRISEGSFNASQAGQGSTFRLYSSSVAHAVHLSASAS